MMSLVLTAAFEADYDALSAPQQEATEQALEQLPAAFGQPHRHGGIGIRKLHASGIYEARIGLALRIVFIREAKQLILHRIGTHDMVRRYLRML